MATVAQNEIFCGGVSGCSNLAVAANSDEFRAAGGNIFIHSVGWDNHTTEAQKNTIVQLWQDHEWGIEMGFSAYDYTSRQNAYKSRYLDRGIQAKFITVNAYSSGRIPEVDDWILDRQAYYDKGVDSSTAIYATFEYQNMAEYQTTLHQNLVSDRTDFQEIITASGGMTLDIPPTVYFRRINSTNSNIRKYHDWILDAIRWAQSRGHTVGIIVSPNSARTNYDEDTKAFVEILETENALPNFFIVENYSPEDPATYDNEVGNEDTPHHQLGCARLLQGWLPVSGDIDPTSGLVAHWPLDEGAGTNAVDASGYGFDGELLNGATWGSDATRDSYVVFDGTDDRIATTFTYALAETNDFTWAWWAKKATAPGADNGSIMVGNRYGNTGSENYEFIKFTPISVQFANSDTAGAIERYDYSDIPQDEWHHYAMVKDGTSYQWYVDGVAQGVASNFVYNESSPLPFLIGGDDDGSGTKVNEHFEGCIDDVVLYREALTPAEVADVRDGHYPYAQLVYELIAGWDTWDSISAPTPTFAAAGITASATAFSPDGNWNTSATEDRGSSKDGTWGTFDGDGNPAGTNTTLGVDCISLLNGRNGSITLTISNIGSSDIYLGAIHFDALAFRANAARTYAVNVLAGSDITVGNVFTSADQAITELGGTAGLKTDDLDPETHDQHDDIDVSLAGIADSTLEVGGVAILELVFSGGTPGNSGHHLWIDNVGITGAFSPVTVSPMLEYEMIGGDMVFNWTGSGMKVQSRTNLIEGVWIDVPDGDSPPVNITPANSGAFFRLIEQ
ncbi:LamG domain-containing protein [Pontiella desulfatans]|nr:LamG domain-containing protein [Pontiella desulfatans]